MKIFRKYFWEDLYYDAKWSIWALVKYFKITIKMRPWDYLYVLMMLEHQVNLLKKCIENGNEADESRIPKVVKINRFLELLNGVIKDDYYERGEKIAERTKEILIEKFKKMNLYLGEDGEKEAKYTRQQINLKKRNGTR